MNQTVAGVLVAVVALVAAAALGASAGYSYATGQQARTQVKVEAKAQDNEAKVEAKNAVDAAPIIKTITETKWRTQTIVKEVPVVQVIHEPAPTMECPAAITGADGVLIDAAARNVDPPAGPIPDGAAIPAQDVTSSVVQNYGACNQYIAQLTGLQQYVRNTIASQRLLCPR